MELNFIQARTLPMLQQRLRVFCSMNILIPIFHSPIYDGTNWTITWYSPIDVEGLVGDVLNDENT